jgi:hypothetical protein
MRRTVKRKNKKHTNGGTRKSKPIKCQTQRTRTLVSKRNSIKLNLTKINLSHIERQPTSDSIESPLTQIIKESNSLTFVSADSLYALIFKISINEGLITVGGRSITEFIMKLCVISPEGILFPRTWFRSEKRSYDQNKFEMEYEFLSENSQLGICPKPIYYNIFDMIANKSIFKLNFNILY